MNSADMNVIGLILIIPAAAKLDCSEFSVSLLLLPRFRSSLFGPFAAVSCSPVSVSLVRLSGVPSHSKSRFIDKIISFLQTEKIQEINFFTKS